MKQWYESLFEDYAEKYDEEGFTQGTVGECDFIEKELGYDKSLRILDIGCGTGRHAIELAERGYDITGVDLSESQLAKARRKAEAAGVRVRFFKQDARSLPYKAEFDAALMLCEGAFPLMETDEMNFEILKGASAAITPRGKLIFTTLNGLFPIFNSIDAFHEAGAKEGEAQYLNSSFDIMTFRDYNTTVFTDDAGNKKELSCNERYYIPSEITWLLKSAGFASVDIYGAKIGAYSREDRLTVKDFEMLVIAEKGSS